jgi:hypothetical protein
VFNYRRSFITGRYPVHITGLQAGTDTNLTPLQFTILSEKLAVAEYESHFIGKGPYPPFTPHHSTPLTSCLLLTTPTLALYRHRPPWMAH